MAGGLVALFDDVAALAKAAAASIDDVGAAAGRATAKAAGVVVDDAAVTPRFVTGVSARRELAIVRRIALGSLRNKLVVILPAVLALTEFLPAGVPVLLLVGGCYLASEASHKVVRAEAHHRHDGPACEQGQDAEDALVAGAVRTDLVLSAEIMVLAADEVTEAAFASRALTLVVVALVITAVVYGSVAAIVKMDDIGVCIARRGSESALRLGRLFVRGAKRLLDVLTVVGTGAMLWVGGHIIVEAADELSLHSLHELVHEARESVRHFPVVGSPLAWSVETASYAAFGLAVGYPLLLLSDLVKPSAHGTGGGASSREQVR